MKISSKCKTGFIVIGIACLALSGKNTNGETAQAENSSAVSIVWSASSSGIVPERALMRWSPGNLTPKTQTTTIEQDPRTRLKETWRGILLSKLVDDALKDLPLEDRAQFDLVILQGQGGETAFIPRALITKYPFLLATWAGTSAKTKELDPVSLYSIVPWTSRPRILTEDLPLENFFVPKVVKISLTNYVTHYGSLFLKRRTDPSAMRGEKIFVQSCASCHTLRPNSNFIDIAKEEKVRRYLQGHHPTIRGVVNLSEKSRKSITRYLDAFRMENGPSLTGLGPMKQMGSRN